MSTSSPWKPLLIVGALSGLAGCNSCVARGARVRTPNGLRPIEELGIGDLVLSLDPISGETIAGPITAVRSAMRETVLLRAAGAELCLTSDHPVYCPREALWAPAGDWVLGARDRLVHLAAEGVVIVPVDSRSTFAGVREVFDLTVDTPHHDFLAEGILVHNKSSHDGGQPCAYEGRVVSQLSPCECGASFGLVECGEDGVGVCSCAVDAGP